MENHVELTRRPHETELQYIWRLGSAKDSGLLDYTWDELAGVLNRNLRPDEEWTESAYRKKYTLAKQLYDEIFATQIEKASTTSQDHEDKIRKLEMAKVQLRDERRSWAAQNRVAARISDRLDQIGESIQKFGQMAFMAPLADNEFVAEGKPSLIVCISDLHIGASFSNYFGEYNTGIAVKRMAEYASKVREIAKRHNVGTIWVALLGDLINGNIHFTSQVSNDENIIQQVMDASEIISYFCNELAITNHVKIVSVSGNHSRLVSNKELAVHDERLDDLIFWIVQKMTQHIPRISYEKNKLDNGIFSIRVNNNDYLGVHGDMDGGLTKQSVSNLAAMFGVFPYAIISGHKHTPAFSEICGVKCVQSGSLCGSGDDYSVEKRLTGSPSQTVLVCDDFGIQCVYNVEFS